MSKFTPGGWWVGDNYEGARQGHLGIHSPEWGALAEVCVETDEGEEIEEGIANARLISAAPDMYGACEFSKEAPKRALAMMEREGFVFDNLDDRWQKLAFSLYTMLVESAGESEQALAKADGK